MYNPTIHLVYTILLLKVLTTNITNSIIHIFIEQNTNLKNHLTYLIIMSRFKKKKTFITMVNSKNKGKVSYFICFSFQCNITFSLNLPNKSYISR